MTCGVLVQSSQVFYFIIPADYWRVVLFTEGPGWESVRDVNLHALTLPRMQYVYVSGNDNAISNDYNLCLPFSAETGMPDYNGIYEAITGEPLAYDDVSAYDSVDKFVQVK